MSFGFSVGDLIGAANLTYRLIKALHGSQDAGEDYRAAIDELGCYQQALMRVSCLGSNKDFPQATFESASSIIMGSMDIIQSYLDKTKKYDRRLGALGSSGLAQGLRKVGWTLFKAEDMKKLRETLHARLSSLGVLLAVVSLDTGGVTPRYLDPTGQNFSIDYTESNEPRMVSGTSESSRSAHAEPSDSRQVHTRSSGSVEPSFGSERAISTGNLSRAARPLDTIGRLDSENSTPLQRFSLSCFSTEELRSIILEPTSRAETIRELSELLRSLISIGKYQLGKDEHHQFELLLGKICSRLPPEPLEELPVKFKDAVGRRYRFPWSLCNTWKGMEALIQKAFLNVEVIGVHVLQGHYDLIGPDGEIILPAMWETIVKPNISITMHMLPLNEPPRESIPPYVPCSPLDLESVPGSLPPSSATQSS